MVKRIENYINDPAVIPYIEEKFRAIDNGLYLAITAVNDLMDNEIFPYIPPEKRAALNNISDRFLHANNGMTLFNEIDTLTTGIDMNPSEILPNEERRIEE